MNRNYPCHEKNRYMHRGQDFRNPVSRDSTTNGNDNCRTDRIEDGDPLGRLHSKLEPSELEKILLSTFLQLERNQLCRRG